MKLVQGFAALSVVLVLASVASLFVTVAPSGEAAFFTLRVTLFASTALSLLATICSLAWALRNRTEASWTGIVRFAAIGLAAVLFAALLVTTA